MDVLAFRDRSFPDDLIEVPRTPENEDAPWAVEAQPGSYMAFFAPWDSGQYNS